MNRVPDSGGSLSVQKQQKAVTDGSARGRVAMLVGNNVLFDSRVQKQALSAARLGWDVTVLGIARQGTPDTWELGGAKVRLLVVPATLGKRHHHRRSGALRSPLAYLRVSNAEFKWNLVQARRAEERLRVALLETTPSTARSATGKVVESGSRFARRAYLGALSRWVGLRRDRTRKHAQRRASMETGLDRATTHFWSRAMGDRAWRHLDPSLWDADAVFAPVLQRLQPDIIHANDFHMLGVGARAKIRLQATGRETKLVWDAHEYLAGMKPWNSHPRWHLARLAFQREYAPHADALVTVSPTLGDLLVVDHELTIRPAVVLNAPMIESSSRTTRNLREDCGLGPDVPLLVYSGAIAPQRGIATVIAALPKLQDVHLAIVAADEFSLPVRALLDQARQLGVAERVHVVGYVPVSDIVSFLSSADIGLIPILHYPNHEIALITKFLEYSHARLPIVVSDVKTMSEMVLRTGQGEVFTAEDVDSFVAAVNKVLADKARYVKAYEAEGLLAGWTWDSAAQVLDAVYEDMHPSASR